ncbi:LPS:glycosyltransferase [Natronococcus occultus SP4]|uniref:LPS:glycosyltransferase n=2 Tax=Natronococcus occultus TaxID=29288 RepID=L0K428_9EURY|nr:LPS:glycosyltransferase [Natronococcus occultus SP4]
MSSGVLYITAGKMYLEEAKESARILKAEMPDISISIVADRPPESELFDEYIELSEPNFGWLDKVENLSRTPYDKTVYFDSDVYVESEFSEIFDILDVFDVAMVPDPNQHPVLDSQYNAQTTEMYSGAGRTLTEFNAGVIAYRMTDSVNDCLDDWQELYDPDEHWSDQPSLRVALSRNDVRFYPLRTQYNYMPGLENLLSGEVKIVHNRLIDSPDLRPRYKDVPPSELQSVIAKVNSNAGIARVAYPALGHGGIESYHEIVVRPPTSPPERLYYSVKAHGLSATVRAYPPVSLVESLYRSITERGVETTTRAIARKLLGKS